MGWSGGKYGGEGWEVVLNRKLITDKSFNNKLVEFACKYTFNEGVMKKGRNILYIFF